VRISISVVIPHYNSKHYLYRCLRALFAGCNLPDEVIVVDDGSSEDVQDVTSQFPVQLHRSATRRGPAFARNLGANAATGDVLLFLDADVCVHLCTVEKVRKRFEAAPELDALIGSYDNRPSCPEFLSQYRNLLHSYVHQSGAERASTFWSGCGAIRRALFLDHSGFNQRFGRPAIEDIELGYRLIRAQRKIVLDRDIQVTHLKTWTFWGLVKTDIVDRGVPWTELILRDRFMPNDLNVHLSQRVSVALVFILVALSCFIAIYSGGFLLVPLFAIVFGLLARWWIEFATPQAPRNASFKLVCAVALIAFFAWKQHMYGIIPPLLISPVLLLIRHRYNTKGNVPKGLRLFGIVYTCCSLGVAALYLPAGALVYICVGILALLGIMNSQFYLFLAANRGVPFMMAAIPFHLLYHFYNGLSFMIGATHYSWTQLTREAPAPPPIRLMKPR
jgi:glycosyltransferase involved in cell wall biosynthesis